jgi:hypothetical protein
MNTEKQFYEAPEAETFVVQFEGALLINSPVSNDNTEPFGSGWNNDL